MRVNYDRIVEVGHPKRQVDRPGLKRASGYAVDLEGDWFWFPAVEPAYAFGRAGRMSAQVGSWSIVEAATEVRYDETLGRDVQTLYIQAAGRVERDAVGDRALLQRFVEGVDSHSSYWKG